MELGRSLVGTPETFLFWNCNGYQARAKSPSHSIAQVITDAGVPDVCIFVEAKISFTKLLTTFGFREMLKEKDTSMSLCSPLREVLAIMGMLE